MLQIKSFPIDNYEEFNKFAQEHPPRSSKTQSGIIFHSDRILIIYDDFKVNPLDKKNIIYAMYEKELQNLLMIEPDIEITKMELEQVTPKQYVEGDSQNVLEAKLKRDGFSKDDIDHILRQMEALTSKVILDTASCNGAKDKIKIYERILATYA